jgi:hypothetical protein
MGTMTVKRETVNGKEMVFIAAELETPSNSAPDKAEVLFNLDKFHWEQGLGIKLTVLKSKYDK